MPRLREYRWREWSHDVMGRAVRAARGGSQVVAVDTETEGLAFHDEAFCATISFRDLDGRITSGYFNLDTNLPSWDACQQDLRDTLAVFPLWVFHNAKFDLQKLELRGITPEPHQRVEDTQTIFNLINENERKALKLLAKSVLGLETNEDEALRKERRRLGLKKEDGYYHLDRRVIVPYALKDTEFTLLLYERLRPQLDSLIAKDPPLGEVYHEELAVSEVLRRMESHGILVDVGYLERTCEEYGIRVMKGLGAVQSLAGDTGLNPNSPQQLLKAFERRGVPLDSTAVDSLREVDDELARMLLQYRSDTKIHKTYLRPLLDEQVDGKVHPWFNPTGARTGRMSSSSASS